MSRFDPCIRQGRFFGLFFGLKRSTFTWVNMIQYSARKILLIYLGLFKTPQTLSKEYYLVFYFG